MNLYNYDTLSKLIGEHVLVSNAQGNMVELTVAEIYKSTQNGETWETFSVIYKGSKDFRISQGTYDFKHTAFGTESIFLTPKSDTEYETIVTRKIANKKSALPEANETFEQTTCN